MSQQRSRFFVSAAAAVATLAFIAPSPAQNGGGASAAADSSAYGNTSGEMPNSPTAESSAANAKASAAMDSEPGVLPSPSQIDGIGGVPAQMGTSGGMYAEMPNSLVPGSTVANAKAAAAMAIAPNSTPMPFSVDKPRP